MGSTNLLAFFFALLSACYMGAAKVVLTEGNATLSFDDSEANFTPKIKGSGECGVLYLAEPLDACTVLTNKAERLSNVSASFVLIVRGGCSFEEKVTRAQNAGFKSAIVYDNEDYGLLIAMAGNSVGINIHAVFVSKASGEMLKKYTGLTNVELWIIPSFENTAWFIMLKSFISLLGMSAVLATCFFIRRRCIRRERPRASSIYRVHGVSRRVVKAMPSLIFTADLEDNCTSGTCAICLVDYSVGEKLRILPCHHRFHAACVDTWLTLWRTFCPVCKRDAITGLTDPPPSESTPLLSVASSISSGRSSLESQPVSHNHRVASTSNVHPSFWSNHQPPSLTVSQNSADLRNASQRSLASPLDSSRSMAYPFDSAQSLSECEVV